MTFPHTQLYKAHCSSLLTFCGRECEEGLKHGSSQREEHMAGLPLLSPFY